MSASAPLNQSGCGDSAEYYASRELDGGGGCGRRGEEKGGGGFQRQPTSCLPGGCCCCCRSAGFLSPAQTSALCQSGQNSLHLSVRPSQQECLEVAREYPALTASHPRSVAPRTFSCRLCPPPFPLAISGGDRMGITPTQRGHKRKQMARQALHCLLEQRRRWRWQITYLHVPLHPTPPRTPVPLQRHWKVQEGQSYGGI